MMIIIINPTRGRFMCVLHGVNCGHFVWAVCFLGVGLLFDGRVELSFQINDPFVWSNFRVCLPAVWWNFHGGRLNLKRSFVCFVKSALERQIWLSS